MGKGIRELTMSPDEPEKEKESGFKSWPNQYGHDYGPKGYDPDRYDGHYDSEQYKKNEAEMRKEDEEAAKLITVTLKVTRKSMGPQYDMDNESYQYDTAGEEHKVKEMAYDRLAELLGKGFDARISIEGIEVSDSYDEFDVEIVLKPLEYKPKE